MRKDRLIISFFVGAIALSVATLSMSLAWYATSTQLRIESIIITIDADRQLAISTKPDEGYKRSLSNDDLKECGLFSPVTAAHNEWTATKSDTPLFYDDTLYTEVEEASSTLLVSAGYFSQKLYLKSDDDVYVTIDPEQTYIKANKEFNSLNAQKLFDEYMAMVDRVNHDSDPNNDIPEDEWLTKDIYEERLNGLVNAMRFSVLVTDEDDYNYIILDPNKSEDTYYGGILDNNVDRYYDYYTRSVDGLQYERVYGEYNDKNLIVYDEPLAEDSDYKQPEEEPNAFNAKHRKNVKLFNLEKSRENGFEIKKEDSHTIEEFEDDNKPFRFPVYRDHPTEIVLSIYIEGWDLDSINYTMGATFDSNLGFIIEREM